MLKKHGRLLSGALATTLTVANMGALMPMTAFAAQPDVESITGDSSGYGGGSITLTYTDSDTVLEGDETIAFTVKDDGDTGSTVTGTPLAYDSDATSTTLTDTLTLGNVSGTVTVAVVYDSDSTDSSNELETLATKEITVTKSEVSSVTVDGTTKYIPTVDFTGDTDYVLTSNALELTATETANSVYAIDTEAEGDIIWAVYSGDTDVTGKFSVTTNSYSAPTSATYTEKVTISDSTAGAGSYTVKAYNVADNTLCGEYSFTVVADPEITVGDEDGNIANSDAVYNGGTVQLEAYKGGTNKLNSGMTWALTDSETYGDYATIDSTGLITATSDSAATITFDGTYAINADMSVKVTPAYTLVLSESDYNIDLSDNTLEIGETATASLLKGTQSVTSGTTTWKSSDTSIATINSSGLITAVSHGTATITATYVLNGTTTTVTTSLTVNEVEYEYYKNGDTTVNVDNTTISVTKGKTVTIGIGTSNGSSVPSYTWNSSNTRVATVDSNGVVTVLSNAATNGTAVIAAYDEDNEIIGTGVTVKAVEAAYTASASEQDLEGTAPDDYTASIYNGDTLTLTAYLDDEEVDGEWSVATAGAGKLKVSGNVVSMQAEVTTDDSTGVVIFDADGDDEADITIKVTAKADVVRLLDADGTELGSGATIARTIALMEVGETYNYSVYYGSTDVTSNVTVTSSNTDVVTVDDGVITAVGEGKNTTVTGTYTADSTLLSTITITITKVTADTGAIEASETAETEAATATTKAAEATEAAETAQTAAAVAKANPTDANLKVATDALADANSALADAQDALEAAQAALAEAEAAGAKSTGAVEAVEAAEAAVEAAEANVAAAEKAVETATAAVKEASTAVDEKKAADAAEKAAAEKAAAQATGATGTDSASGNAYKVTDGSSKTVAITKASSKASGKVTIPSTVTISGDKFTVTEISANAFKGNKKIKQVVIPKTVTKIGKNAFKNCSKVTKITIKATKNLTVGKNAFKGLKDGSKIVVKGVSGSAKKKLVKKVKKQVTSSRTTVK